MRSQCSASRDCSSHFGRGIVPITEISRHGHISFRVPKSPDRGSRTARTAFTGDIAMKISGIRLLGAMLCIAVSGVAAAQDASPIQISNAVFQEVEVKADDGSVATKLVPAAKVVPGAEVVYEISYRNNGTEPATDLAIDNPLPKEVVFVDASVQPTTVSV